MTKTSSCWRFAAAVSPLALIIAGSPALAADKNTVVVTGTETAAAAEQPAAGQPAPAADQTAANPQDNTIVITGFRASLRSSTAKKKSAETVDESVNAEDIGKLPDNSTAESI